MPELPDVALYLEHLAPRVLNQTLQRVVVRNPFVLRSFDPPISDAAGKQVLGLRRMGKRIVFALEGELFLVIHLMIAGRLKWYPVGKKAGGKLVLAVLEFPEGLLFLTEAGTKRRASIHLVSGEMALQPVRARWAGGAGVGSRKLCASASDRRTTPSSARSPIRGCSAASATPTPTRSCTAPSFRRSRSPAS